MRSANSKISIVLALLLIALCRSEESTEEPVISVSNSTQLWSNGTREARGLLETIQTVVQTVQGVNKLFGNTGGASSNKEIDYKNPNFQAQNGFYHGGSSAGNVGNYGNFHTSNNYQAAQQLQQLGIVQQPQGAQGAAIGSNLYPNYNGIVPAAQGYHQANPNVIGSHNNEYYGSSATQVHQSLGSHAGVNYNQYYPGGYQQHTPVRDSSPGIHTGSISKQGYIPGSGGLHNSVLAGGGSLFGGSGALPSGATSTFGGGAGFPGGSYFGGAVPGGSGVPSGALSPNFGSISGASRPTFGGLASLLNGGASGLGGGSSGGGGLASLLSGGTSSLGGGSGSAIASLLGGAASSLLGAGASNAASAGSGGSSALLSGLNELGILNDLGDVLSIRNVEKLLGNVNKFDALKCIPRMVCETISKRQQEAEKHDSTSTTTTTTRRPKHKKRSDEGRGGRFIPGLKIQGVDTALEQFVKLVLLFMSYYREREKIYGDSFPLRNNTVHQVMAL